MGRPDPFNRRLREQVSIYASPRVCFRLKRTAHENRAVHALSLSRSIAFSISRRAGAAMRGKPLHHRRARLIETHHLDLHVVAAQLEHDVIERTN